MEEGWQTSKHMHPVKDETMLVIDGAVMAELWENGPNNAPKMMILRGEDRPALRILPGKYHRLATSLGEDAVIVEFSTHHSNDDVVRKEDSKELTQSGGLRRG